jgi:hypothetical protein
MDATAARKLIAIAESIEVVQDGGISSRSKVRSTDQGNAGVVQGGPALSD